MTTHIFLFLLAFHLVAKADDRLIQIECHNALAPETCIQCLKSDSRSLNAGKFAIAIIIIDCLDKQAVILADKFSALAKKNDSENGYEDCVKYFLLAKKKLKSAAKEIQNADYDSADRLVYYARGWNSMCYAIGKGPSHPNATGPLDSEMEKFDELSEAAMRIIERF